MDYTAIIDELNDHGFDDASDERKLSVINDTMWDVCGREPWPFLEKTVALTFTGSASTPSNLPTDFQSVLICQQTDTSNAGRLKPIRYDDWLQRYGANQETAGTPRYYYFIAGQLNFYPKPASTCVITMQYLKTPAALLTSFLETDIPIPLQFHRSVLVNGALFKLYAMEDDTDISPTFETFYERGLQNMRAFCWKKQWDSPDIIHPVDADDIGLDQGYGGWVG